MTDEALQRTYIALIDGWVRRQVDATAIDWFDDRRRQLEGGYTDRALHITLGMIPRRLGKADLDLSPDDLAAAEAARAGWNPSLWSVADAARVLVMLETARAGNVAFAQRLTDLCRSADVAEAIALYRGLPLYPQPESLLALAGEGLRTNMRTVFEAVAHHSPYPSEQFDTARWNQLVLKALFIDSQLDPIVGLDARANPELAGILSDYAHERWAAGRSVSPELWRCVGPFATGSLLDDLERAFGAEDPIERQAARLALQASPDDRAADILAAASPSDRDDVPATWSSIAAALR